MTSIHTLQKTIMRRVWYSYIIYRATHPLTVHGIVLAAAIYLLSRLIHVVAIGQNVSNMRVGDLFSYATGTLTNTEWSNLLLLGIIIMTALSLRWQLPRVRLRQLI